MLTCAHKFVDVAEPVGNVFEKIAAFAPDGVAAPNGAGADAEMVIEPAPLVMLTFAPAVKLARVKLVPLPIKT